MILDDFLNGFLVGDDGWMDEECRECREVKEEEKEGRKEGRKLD